jgi:hypothetical protein
MAPSGTFPNLLNKYEFYTANMHNHAPFISKTAKCTQK